MFLVSPRIGCWFVFENCSILLFAFLSLFQRKNTLFADIVRCLKYVTQPAVLLQLQAQPFQHKQHATLSHPCSQMCSDNKQQVATDSLNHVDCNTSSSAATSESPPALLTDLKLQGKRVKKVEDGIPTWLSHLRHLFRCMDQKFCGEHELCKEISQMSSTDVKLTSIFPDTMYQEWDVFQYLLPYLENETKQEFREMII